MTSEVGKIPDWRKYTPEEKEKLKKEAHEIMKEYYYPEPTEEGPRRFNLPKGFQVRFRKCGKNTCKCASGGENLHGPYLYKVTYDKIAKKQHWQYLGRYNP